MNVVILVVLSVLAAGASGAKSLKEYERTPCARQFLNADAVELRRPCVFRDVGSNVLDKKREESFKHSFLNIILYGHMVELVRDSRGEESTTRPAEIVSKINLRKFFKQIDEYALETSMQFSLPMELRAEFELPSQLNHESLITMFQTTDMQVHLNYDNYSPAAESELDQLICSVKNEASIQLSKSKESYETNLKPGQCLFVPAGWAVAVKTQQVWFISIKWQSLSEPIPKEEGEEEDDEEAAPKKLIGVFFPLDANIPLKPFVTHASTYFKTNLDSDEETSYNKTAFLEKLKTDPVLSMGIFNWDQKALELSSKLFKVLDVDRDGSFSIDDFEQLDAISAAQLNDKIQAVCDAFAKIQEEQAEQLKKILAEWKTQPDKLEMRRQLAEVFRVRMAEWHAGLSEAEKEDLKAKNVDINVLIEQLLDVKLDGEATGEPGDDEARERLKQKIIAENQEKRKQRESADAESSMFEDDVEPIKIKSIDDDIDEIFADDEDDDDDNADDDVKSEL